MAMVVVSQVLAPTPVLDVLQDAAAATGEPGQRLFAAVRAAYPDCLTQRPVRLLREADATPRDLERLLEAAGFADFEELRDRVATEVNRRLTSPDLRLTARVDPDREARELLGRILDREQANLRRTLQDLQANGALELAADRITAARRRFVAGGLKSAAYATLLAADLTASMPHVQFVPDTAAAAVDLLADVRRSDVLVVFSLRRYSRRTVALAQGFHAAGGQVIAVTDDADGPVARHSDVAVVVATSSLSYADSPTAVAAVVHVLATLATAGAKGARRRLQRRSEVARALRIYEED